MAPDIAEAATLPRRSRFEKLVGETFVATHQGRKVRLRLDAVSDASYRPSGLRGADLARWRRKAFVLVFSTRSDIEQGTWSLRTQRSSRFRLFVVPGRTEGRHATVTATFNGWKG